MKKNFFILIMMIIGIIMIMRTFFGGNKKEEPITKQHDGLINQLNISGSQSEIRKDVLPSTGNSVTTEHKNITIIMPEYLYTSGRKHFAEDLHNNENIDLSFSFIDNLNSYRDIISNHDFYDADLFLFPYDRHEIVKTQPFSFQQDIQLAFDSLLTPITESTPTYFLPFSIDPMIMYSSSGLKYSNFSTITDTIYNRKSPIQISFPLFFGLTNEDLNNEGFNWEYQDIVRYALMHYFEVYQDSQSLGIWIDSNIIKDSEYTRNYNIPDLNKILNTIPAPQCKDFPALCFQIYNFVGIRIGFLSDADIVQKYFNQKKSNFDKLYKNTTPFSTIESPVRVRGLGINPNLTDIDSINNIYILLAKYINEHKNYNFRSSTLSPFKQEGNSLYDNQFINRGYILSSGGNYINALKNNNSFKQLIDYKISADDYLIRKL